MNDTIQIAADSVMQITPQETYIDWWMVVAIAEFVIIICLLFVRRNKASKKRDVKRQVKKEGDINFDNVIASSFGAEALYKELIRKCHPDRFAPDVNKVAIANDITERLGKYKHDLNKLNELKREAIHKLKIVV